MKAYVLYGVNELKYEEVKTPQPERGNVLVKVAAAGICGSDIPRIYQTGAHRHPLIPGHEFSGTVVKAGDRESEVWVNKRVGVFPLIPCRKCIPCKKQEYEMCRNYNYLGSRCDGGFAEYVAVPKENLIELPADVSFEEAAMLEPMSVAVHAMRMVMYHDGVHEAGRDDNAHVVVYGLGTIGLLLVMFLLESGVKKLSVVGNKEFQKKCTKKLGLGMEDFCDSRSENVEEWVLEKTEGKGADIVFECIGKNTTIEDSVNMAAPGGRLVFVGNPSSDILFGRQTYWKILRNQLKIRGTWNSSFTGSQKDDWHYVIKKLANGSVAPSALISHRFSLEDMEHGFKIMRDKSEDYVKIMGIFQN